MPNDSADSKTLRIEWNGTWQEVTASIEEIREVAPGHFLITNGSAFQEVFQLPDGSLSDGEALDGVQLKIETEREKIVRDRFQGRSDTGTLRTGTLVVKAPMPGLVRVVRVEVGDLVDRASILVVLEAMKMENNIVANGKGHVKAIFVEEGSSVEKNAPLIEIELA